MVKNNDPDDLVHAFERFQKALNKEKAAYFTVGDGGIKASPEERQAVKDIQKALGMPAELQTGYFGEITKQKLTDFQASTLKDADKANDLAVDSKAGLKTARSLFQQPEKKADGKTVVDDSTTPKPAEMLKKKLVDISPEEFQKGADFGKPKNTDADKVVAYYTKKFGTTDIEPVKGGNAESGSGMGKFGQRAYQPVRGASINHVGTDFKAGLKDQVLAPFGGVVTKKSSIGVEYALSNGLTMRDLHVTTNRKVGDHFKAGDVIAEVANVGPSTGPHLHREFKDPSTGLNLNALIFHDPEKMKRECQSATCEKRGKDSASFHSATEMANIIDHSKDPTQVADLRGMRGMHGHIPGQR